MFSTRATQGYTVMFTWPWDGKKNAGEVLCRFSSIGILKLVASKTVVVSSEENLPPKVKPVRIFEKRNKFYARGEDGVERVLPEGSVRQLSCEGEVYNVCDVLTVQPIKIGITRFDAVGCFGSSLSGVETIFYMVDAEKVGLPPDCAVVHLVDLLDTGPSATSPSYSPVGYVSPPVLDDNAEQVGREAYPGFEDVERVREKVSAISEVVEDLKHEVGRTDSTGYWFLSEEEAKQALLEERLDNMKKIALLTSEMEELKKSVEDKVAARERFVVTGDQVDSKDDAYARKRKEKADAEMAALKEAERLRIERDARHEAMGVKVEGGITKIRTIVQVETPGKVEGVGSVRKRGKSTGRG